MNRRRENGWALVSVLWVLSILAMIAAATQALTLTSSRLEQRAFAQARMDALLDAGIVRGIAGLSDNDRSKRWRIDGISRNFTFDGADIQVSIQDELGRFDLNMVDDSVLHALFVSAALSDGDADTMTDRVLDWRSSGDFHRLHGATVEDYAAAGYHYRPRRGPFQSVDELQLVMGMTPDVFARIRPALTVYTGNADIDPGLGTREALTVLFDSDKAKVDAVLRARTEPGGGDPQSHTGIIDPAIPLAGRAFTIVAEIAAPHRRYVRQAVVEMTGNDRQPYLVLDWR